MTLVLIKLLVCPRLRDDHSGRLVVSQHKLVIYRDNWHRRPIAGLAQETNCRIGTRITEGTEKCQRGTAKS